MTKIYKVKEILIVEERITRYDNLGFIATILHQDSSCWKGSKDRFQFNLHYIETNGVQFTSDFTTLQSLTRVTSVYLPN